MDNKKPSNPSMDAAEYLRSIPHVMTETVGDTSKPSMVMSARLETRSISNEKSNKSVSISNINHLDKVIDENSMIINENVPGLNAEYNHLDHFLAQEIVDKLVEKGNAAELILLILHDVIRKKEYNGYQVAPRLRRMYECCKYQG